LPAKDVNDDACYLDERVIVDVHRRQAGSYMSIAFIQQTRVIVDVRRERACFYRTYLPISNLPIAARCTSSGPSARRRVRCIAYM